ncbi:MAG: glycine cleavage system aminomethyltransferase GcvT, partial [Candidatus Promineifilaceae bacterium]
MPNDFIFRGSVDELDPELTHLIKAENQRQDEAVILVASESTSPTAVQALMGSTFGNIYAEGYPREESRQQTEEEILDIDYELAHYRRYSDPRYYKGVEYADILEALARRRAAELFAANGITADNLYVNVQPLSGSPANIAVYSALLEHGDTLMGLDLNHGGHLTHGSKISRSGKAYNAVSYTVDPVTESLDYDAIEALAMEVKPKLIVSGFTAYPLLVDWQRFRQIADRCGAYLMADIAHISGLVAAGVHPSPIGIADVVTTTTHKSLCGPRGAMIMTHRKELARKIDRAVFPGEQGGPHLNTIAALALALKLAKSQSFVQLQQQVARNAARLAEKLNEQGLRIVGGKSENHLLMIDTKSVKQNGIHLSGDMAARILDLAGIVANRNTIPGDTSAFRSTGVRMGTVWVSQLGFKEAEIDRLAEAIATILKGCTPFAYTGLGGKELLRAKVDYQALQDGREIVRQLRKRPFQTATSDTIEIRGAAAPDFLNLALTSDVLSLAAGESQPTHIYGPNLDTAASLSHQTAGHYWLRLPDSETALAVTNWFKALSDGFVQFDDVYAKLPGPVVVTSTASAENLTLPASNTDGIVQEKPYFIGRQYHTGKDSPLPAFEWQESEEETLLLTKLHDTHIAMGARMVPFGGWDMPVWYTSVSEEHNAVRTTAGLFDVSHMGVLEASGPYAAEFLNLVTTNDIDTLEIGQSHYTYLLFPDGRVVDDLLIYRRGEDKYMLVVNASNNDKDWAWLTAVNDGRVQIDAQRPEARLLHPATLRDLRDPQWGAECLVDLALQGPRSLDILLAMCDDPALAARIKGMGWARLTEGKLAGFDVVISRTGYTGERVAYELFVHPDQSPAFWQALLEAGEPFGLKPCGLAARDSTRTEAGLPLYGHELDGPLDLNPAQAGFGSYVKLWKPFFVGREAFITKTAEQADIVVRFRMNEKGVRRPELGDPILDKRGKVVGTVTSCAIDQEGYLLGQALVPLSLSTDTTTFAIYQLGGGQRSLKVPDT